MSLATRLDARAAAYVRKPSLAPTLPGMPDGPNAARLAAFHARELAACHAPELALTRRADLRAAMGTLRSIVQRELSIPTDPED